jgi:phosphoglycolate phosphatase-like HAD superfamily hydrolase
LARIDDLIEVDASAGDAERSKPHPDIFDAALKKLRVIELAQVIVIGDTPHDAEAAAHAHIRMVGLLSGGWSEKRLREVGCVEIYRHPADLLARYDQSLLGYDFDR